MLDGIGATEMLHIFISNRLGDSKTGMHGHAGAGLRGAGWWTTRCRKYHATPSGGWPCAGPPVAATSPTIASALYVRDGWNLTGDSFLQDDDGYFHFVARSDDMIISSGYNIAGPEVEAALLSHADVVECAVIGVPDESRGQIVQAHVVLAEGVEPSEATIVALQDHVKAAIAPYKYPRSIVFTDALPKTQTGKIQRFRLRQPTVASRRRRR